MQGGLSLAHNGGGVQMGDLNFNGNKISASSNHPLDMYSTRALLLQPAEDGVVRVVNDFIVKEGGSNHLSDTRISSRAVKLDSTLLNAPISFASRGESMQFGGLQVDGSSINGGSILGLTTLAESNILLNAKKQDVLMSGESVALSADEVVSLTGKKVIMKTTGLGSDINLGVKGGNVLMGSLSLEGSILSSSSGDKGLSLRSSSGVVLKAEKESHFAGKSVRLSASDEVQLTGENVTIDSTQWNSAINIDSASGAIVHGVHLHPRGLHSGDKEAELVLRSRDGDVNLFTNTHGTVDVKGGSFVMSARKGNLDISAGIVKLESKHANEDLKLSALQGDISMAEILLDATSLHSKDVHKPFTISDPNKINLEGKFLLVNYPEVEVQSDKAKMSSSGSVSMRGSASMRMKPRGGHVDAGDFHVEGNLLTSSSAANGLSLRSENDLHIKPKGGKDVRIQGGAVGVSAVNNLRLSSHSMTMMSTTEMKIDNGGLGVDINHLRVTGSVLNGDVKDLEVNADASISLLPAPSHKVEIVGNVKVADGNELVLSSSQLNLESNSLNENIHIDKYGPSGVSKIENFSMKGTTIHETGAHAPGTLKSETSMHLNSKKIRPDERCLTFHIHKSVHNGKSKPRVA
jgi:hypothetical protein